VFEEMYGDAHTEGLVRSLFDRKARDKIAIVPNLALSAQPTVMAQI
jgi:hypothetical protein